MMEQQRCMPTMTAMAAMAETATAAATAMAMMPPLPPTATMLMTTMVVIWGRQLDDGNLMTTMGQRWCRSTMTAVKVMAEMAMATAMVTLMATAMATAMMLPPPPMAMMLMKTTAAIRGWQLGNGNWMMTMGWWQWDGNRQPATCRTFASAVPSIKATIN